MITCAEAVRRLWDYVDGVVDEPERHEVEEHLSLCRRCCGELEFAGELRKVLASQAADELPEDVQARLLSALDGLERGS